MLQQVGQTLLQSLQVLVVQLGLGHAAVILQGADGGNDDHGVGVEPASAALDVQELLSAQVGSEASLGDGVVGQLHSGLGGLDGVAAVGNVGEGAAVDESGGVLQSLDHVGLDGVLQNGSHGTLGLQVVSGDGLAGTAVSHDHLGQAGLHVGQVGGQAQNSHDLRSHDDVEAVLTGHAGGLAAQAAHDVTQLTVVHINNALPGDVAHVDVQSVALLDVVVDQGGHQVVGDADGVEVAGEVQVDVLHGDDLSVAAAGSAALHAEHGAQGGLTQADDGLLAHLVQSVGQTHGSGGLALASGGGADGGHQHQLGLAGQVLQGVDVDLGLVVAIVLQLLGLDAHLGGNLLNGEHLGRLGDFDIGHV